MKSKWPNISWPSLVFSWNWTLSRCIIAIRPHIPTRTFRSVEVSLISAGLINVDYENVDNTKLVYCGHHRLQLGQWMLSLSAPVLLDLNIPKLPNIIPPISQTYISHYITTSHHNAEECPKSSSCSSVRDLSWHQFRSAGFLTVEEIFELQVRTFFRDASSVFWTELFSIQFHLNRLCSVFLKTEKNAKSESYTKNYAIVLNPINFPIKWISEMILIWFTDLTSKVHITKIRMCGNLRKLPHYVTTCQILSLSTFLPPQVHVLCSSSKNPTENTS